MKTIIKKWIYKFVTSMILSDEIFIMRMDSAIKAYNKRLSDAVNRSRQDKIDAQQRQIAARVLADKKKRQDDCDHMKGGRGVKSPHGDYNIWEHTFTDGRTEIHCGTCGKVWTGEDLKSDEVRKMRLGTTNIPSSSEVSHGKPTYRTDICSAPTEAEKQAYLEKEARLAEEMRNNPLWPWASRGYVKYWDKMLKRLSRKKKKVK